MRNWKYVMMSLALTGAIATFTGCIDTDEPNGISELRSAKSELIKAQASLKLADVSFREAETALKLAEVEGAKIANQLQELLVEKERLAVELVAATNEKEIADLQKEMDKIEQERAEMAERHKATMLGLEEATAKAQESYDNAIKAIEAAKALLSDEEQAVLTKAQNALTQAKNTLTSSYSTVESAQNRLLSAIKAETKANLELTLNHALAEANAGLKAAEKTVEEIEGFLGKDVVTTDWEKEVIVLEDAITELKIGQSEALAERKRLEINHSADKKEVDRLKTESEDAGVKEITISEYEKTVAQQTIIDNLNSGTPVTGYDNGVFSYEETVFTNEEYVDSEIEDAATTTIETIEGWLELIAEVGVTNQEEIEYAKIDLANQKIAVKEASDEATEAIKEWSDAKKAYNDAEDVDKPAALIDYQAASDAAFGTLLNFQGQPRINAVTKEEIDAYIEENPGTTYSQFGALGTQLAAMAEQERLEDVVAQSDLYLALAKDLQDQLAAVTKIAEDNKNFVADAVTAYEEADAAYQALFADVDAIDTEYGVLISSYYSLIEILQGNIRTYLTDHTGKGYLNYAAFTEALEKALLDAQKVVVTNQGKVLEAEKDLELFEAGEYTEQYAINKAELELEVAMNAYDAAKTIYDDAYARLQEVISILLG
ncbi:MAG: hypothetical protein LUG98_02360 [Tannerellaceae bacterium]|nr:hypothetical protein [Tannerellaceae bacterium]